MFAIGPLQAVVLPTFFSGVDGSGSGGGVGGAGAPTEPAPQLLGAALATVAVGLILGALLSAPLMSRAGRRPSSWWPSSASLVGLGRVRGRPVSRWSPSALRSLVGLGFGLLAPVLPVLVTEHVPEAARARVFGLQNAGYLAAYPLGALLIGFVVQVGDVRAGAIVCAALWGVLVVFGLVSPALQVAGAGECRTAA